MATKFVAGDKVSIYAPGVKGLHNRLGTVVAYDPISNLFDVHLRDGEMPKKFYYSELLHAPVDTTPEKGYDKDMKEQQIATGTRVHVNAPNASAVHGKAGVVKGFDPSSGMYTVLLDRFSQANEPSFFYIFELVPETSPQVRKFATVKDELTTLHAKYRALHTTTKEDLEKYEKTLADIESVLAFIDASE